MPVGVAVLDPDGTVTLHNNRLSEILGLPSRKTQNLNLWDFLEIDYEKLVQANGEMFEGPVELDITITTKKESRKHLNVAIVANKDQKGITNNHIVVVSDVTTRRRTEEEREQQRRVISLYASLLTHDVGNDLQALLGYVEGAGMISEDNPEQAKTMLVSAEAAGKRMSNLIKTFKVDSILKHVTVTSMLREVAKEAELVDLGLKIHLDFDPKVEDIRSPGGFLLSKAIENIFRNAAQHAGVKPEINVRVDRSDDLLVISISDNGPGIPVEIRNSLFHRSDRYRENGLGLYLTKQIVTACGGSIRLDENSEATGASFIIKLPITE
jgi:PAS domain S-box-containing protein